MGYMGYSLNSSLICSFSSYATNKKNYPYSPYNLIEDMSGYVVRLPQVLQVFQILKNSRITKETATERTFLMKDCNIRKGTILLLHKKLSQSS